MKNTIWSKLLVFVAVPLLLIFGVSAAFVVNAVLQDKISEAELEVRNLAEFNEANLKGYIENIKLSVMIAAVELKDIDPSRSDARLLGERIILASFENRVVYNSWLIFEPNAFDGMDAEHRGEYPGETSGRYMRSFSRAGDSYEVAPDMDEADLDDMKHAYWYLIPKSTGKLFIDINADVDVFWDYGTGDGILNSLSIVSPIFRNGEFIGCVGQDIVLTDILLGPELIPGSESALFDINGILLYHRDSTEAGKVVVELGFDNPGEIMDVFARRKELYQSNVYSPLLQAQAFTCFLPVELSDFNETAYLYAALPGSMVWNAVFRILRPLAVAMLIAMVIFTLSLIYLTRIISLPIHKLTMACEAISLGNLDGEIAQSWADDEIGIMTRSLRRVVEQFRIFIIMQEQSGELLDIYTRLYRALYKHNRFEDVFDEVVAVACDYFKFRRASLVFVEGEHAWYNALYEQSGGLRKISGDFIYHHEVKPLIAKRRYITLNANTLEKQKINFLEKDTLFLCILPIRAGEKLKGYVLFEGDESTGPLVHTDAALVFVADTISYMLETGGNKAQPVSSVTAEPLLVPPPPPSAEIPGSFRDIEGLDVDRGLSLLGGAADHYGELLRISARVFAEGVQKMHGFYETDISAFAIEVHGMKGALYTIGATLLGDKAKDLEFAAKAGDAALCKAAYPPFEKELSGLAAKLSALTERKAESRGKGSLAELAPVLRRTLEFAQNFDSAKAIESIASVLDLSWESPFPLAENLRKISDFLKNIDYDVAERLISELLETLEAGDAGE